MTTSKITNPYAAPGPVAPTPVVEPRVRKAREASRGASRWATPVVLLTFPVMFWEMGWPFFMSGQPEAGTLVGLILAGAFCGGLWAVWVGSAWCVGYLRGPLS